MVHVLVTGAGGFVGQAVVGDLAAAGHIVRGLVRSETALADGVEIRVVNDAVDAAERDGVLDDVDVVVHLAARVHRMDESGDELLDRYIEDNASATRRLALAAAKAGVKRFIFVSTVKVHDDDGDRPCAENDPTRPDDAYGISKLRAEQALAEVGKETGLETVVLRPPLIYGPGVKANFRTLLKLADSPLPLPLGGIAGNQRSYLYLGNLLNAIRAALINQRAPGRTYLVSDGEDISTTELVARLRAAFGRKRRLIPVPLPILSAAASIIGKNAIIEPLTGSRRIDDSRIRQELNWQPPYTLDQGLAATAAWFRTERGR